jgi:hypothetical protein
MHDRLRLTQAKMPDEVQLELLAPWYTLNTSESRSLDFFDAIPKYPFAVTTTIPKPERLEVPLTLRGKKYTAFVAPAQITDARTGQERLSFLALLIQPVFAHSRRDHCAYHGALLGSGVSP